MQQLIRYGLIREPVTEKEITRAILRQLAEGRRELVEVRVPETAPGSLPGIIEGVLVTKSCNCSPGQLTFVEQHP